MTMRRLQCMMLLQLIIAGALLLPFAEARWYSQICPTGPINTVTRDASSGSWVFVSSSSQNEEENNNNNTISDEVSNRSLRSSYRWLPESDDLEFQEPALRLSSPNIRSLSQTQFIQQEDSSAQDSYEIPIRPCMCYPSQYYTENDGPPQSSTIPGQRPPTQANNEDAFYACPIDADYCGIPFQEDPDQSVGCYTINVQQVVARNAWPLILLWYLGLAVICVCTIHGYTAKEFLVGCCCTCCNSNASSSSRSRLEQRANELLSPDGNRAPVGWNCWAWQRFRFHQTMLASSSWIWRQEEYERARVQQADGLPPPRLELRIKKYHVMPDDENDEMRKVHEHDNGEHETEHVELPEQPAAAHEDEHDGGNDELDSLDEPTCTICFVPLEEGDRVGDLVCSHVFHVECLKTWLVRRNACPLCAQPMAQLKRPERPTIPQSSSEGEGRGFFRRRTRSTQLEVFSGDLSSSSSSGASSSSSISTSSHNSAVHISDHSPPRAESVNEDGPSNR